MKHLIYIKLYRKFFYWETVCSLLFINSSFPQLSPPLAFFPLLKNRTSIWRLPQKHFSEGLRQDSWKVPMSEFTLRKLFFAFIYFLLLFKCKFISEEIFLYQSQHCINIEIILCIDYKLISAVLLLTLRIVDFRCAIYT